MFRISISCMPSKETQSKGNLSTALISNSVTNYEVSRVTNFIKRNKFKGDTVTVNE